MGDGKDDVRPGCGAFLLLGAGVLAGVVLAGAAVGLCGAVAWGVFKWLT